MNQARCYVNLNLPSVPFSRFGSYMAFNIVPDSWNLPGILLRTARWTPGQTRELMRIELLAGKAPAPAKVRLTPDCLRLEGRHGVVEIIFAEPDVLRIRGEGAGLRLSTLNNNFWEVMPLQPGQWQLNPPVFRTQYLATVISGQAELTRHAVKPKSPPPQPAPSLQLDLHPGDSGIVELALEELVSTPTGTGIRDSFAALRKGVRREWEAWRAHAPVVAPRYRAATELAMYVNWAAAVAPSGLNRRTTLLMSKNWMSQCWSWDHCFNAMALAPQDPGLAWDQMLTLFDHQDQFGCLPDSLTAGTTSWSAVKPPIHGWAVSYMARTKGVVTGPRIRRFYPALEAWTRWWLKHRLQDGLPVYLNGCDSGWDNGTVFDGGCPVWAPDAAAYLVLQTETLSWMAAKLGRRAEAAHWKRLSSDLLARLLDTLWNGRQFVTLRKETGQPHHPGDCLLNFLPIILGPRLPAPCFNALCTALRPGGRFVTPHGLASESPASTQYQENGYWRGPIWAPPSCMIIDGLATGGATHQARALARRFADTCSRSGFSENFNALTGAPLCDPAYTWTSSTFLLLAQAGYLAT